MPSDFRVVLVTAPSLELAEKLSIGLVESKLAACVTTLPHAVSTYRWEGKVEKAQEVQLVIKTKSGVLPALVRFIKERHSAAVPEILSLVVDEGNKEYLDWIGASTLFSKPRESPTLPL